MTGIVIQARMGSNRLPGKVLLPVGNRNILEHILERISILKNEIVTVIATSKVQNSNPIEEFCDEHSVECFRGSETNVLERYYKVAVKYNFSNIVRLTGDNPFYDVEELDALIDEHIDKRNDYTDSYSVLPIGVGAEIFSFHALKKVYEKSSLPHHFEHVDEYLLENKSDFKTSVLQPKVDKCFPDVRLTVDTKEDYMCACYIANHSSTRNVTTQEAIGLFDEYKRNHLY